MKFDIFEWQRELLGADLTAGEFRAIIATATFANSKTGLEACPSAEQVAALSGTGKRVVYAAWDKAHKQGLITKVQQRRDVCRFTLRNAPWLKRFVPTKANGGDSRTARMRTKDCADAHQGLRGCARNQTKDQTIDQKEQPERAEGSITDDYVGDEIPIAAYENEQQDDDMTTSDEMRAALNADLLTPKPPPGMEVYHDLPLIDVITHGYHVTVFGQVTGRAWPAKWDVWARQFIRHMTPEMHKAWMGRLGACANFPGLGWHTPVVRDLLNGTDTRKPYVADANSINYDKPTQEELPPWGRVDADEIAASKGRWG